MIVIFTAASDAKDAVMIVIILVITLPSSDHHLISCYTS